MQTNQALLSWAESWHWPQLVLSERDKTCVQAGEHKWRAWVAGADRKGKRQAWQRIHRWQQLTEKKAG